MAKKRKTIVVRLIGESPMLMHNPESMLMESDEAKVVITNPTTKEAIESIAETNCYRNADGILHPPRGAVKGSMINAAKFRKIGKIAATTAISAGVRVKNDLDLILVHPKTSEPITKYDIDKRTAVNKNTAGRIIVIRPMIKEWMIEVELELNLDFVLLANALEILNLAGDLSGIGAYGPRKKGDFGRFRAELVE